MIDHISLSVSDYEAARRFYEMALAPLGIGLLFTVPVAQTDGAQVGGFGTDRPRFWIMEGARQRPPVHVAFSAHARAQVDAFHAAALAAGGQDNGAPGLRPEYHADYYAAFVRDPDGNNIEAVCGSPDVA